MVKSLSKSEKRYFRLQSSLHALGGSNRYDRLFEAMSKQKEYDEAALKKELGDLHFAFSKNYLQQNLLASLSSFHAGAEEAQLLSALQQVRILYDKGLYTHCHKLVLRIKKQSLATERFAITVQAIRWERTLASASSYSGMSMSSLDTLHKENEQLLRRLKNTGVYEDLMGRLVFTMARSGVPANSKGAMKVFREVIQHPLLRSEKEALSLSARSQYLTIRSIYSFYVEGDRRKAYGFDKKRIVLMEKHPWQIHSAPADHITALRNFLITCISLGKYSEAEKVVGKMREVPKRYGLRLSTSIMANIFNQSYLQELSIFINTGQYHRINALIKELENGFRLYEGKMKRSSERELNYTIAYIFFSGKQNRKALAWLNRIIHSRDQQTRQDLVCYSRILALMLHYELGDQEYIPYLLRSTYRFLKKRGDLFPEEKLILDFIKKALKARGRPELAPLFNEVSKKFKALSGVPFQGTIDVIAWLEEKAK